VQLGCASAQGDGWEDCWNRLTDYRNDGISIREQMAVVM